MRFVAGLVLTVFFVAGVALGGAGVWFMNDSVRQQFAADQSSRLMTNGIICLSVGGGIALASAVMLFVASFWSPRSARTSDS